MLQGCAQLFCVPTLQQTKNCYQAVVLMRATHHTHARARLLDVKETAHAGAHLI
jgi:uncharacterized protein YeaC (DUF1315 family)